MGIQEVAIPVHAIAASLVILLAPVNIIRRRKDTAHKTIGRSWVIAIYLTCVSGMFIYINGGFTIFHALAIYTFVTTTLGVIAIRRGKKREHVRHMTASWVAALIAGSFAAFVPGRYIPTLAVSDPLLLGSVVAALVAASTLWVAWVLAYFGRKPRSRRKSRDLVRHRRTTPRRSGPSSSSV